MQQTYVAPLVSVTKSMMFYLKEHILNIEGVQDVIATTKTPNAGRWNILIDKKMCHSTRETLQNKLPELLNYIPIDASPPEGAFYVDPTVLGKDTDSVSDDSFFTRSLQSFESIELSSDESSNSQSNSSTSWA